MLYYVATDKDFALIRAKGFAEAKSEGKSFLPGRIRVIRHATEAEIAEVEAENQMMLMNG